MMCRHRGWFKKRTSCTTLRTLLMCSILPPCPFIPSIKEGEGGVDDKNDTVVKVFNL